MVCVNRVMTDDRLVDKRVAVIGTGAGTFDGLTFTGG